MGRHRGQINHLIEIELKLQGMVLQTRTRKGNLRLQVRSRYPYAMELIKQSYDVSGERNETENLTSKT